MRLVLSSLTYPLPNGVTSSINESVDGLLAAGHEVRIIAPDYGSAPVRAEHIQVSGSSVGRNVLKIFGILGKKERNFGLAARGDIEREVKRFKPDVLWLHTVTYAPNAFERFAARSGIPLVLTYHTMVDVYGKIYAGPIGEKAMQLRSKDVCNLATQVITPSQYMKNRLLDFGVETPVTVIPTGILPTQHPYLRAEVEERFSIKPSAKLLIFVGRIVKEKNVEFLLDALKEIVKHEPNTILLMIGPGDIEQTKQKADELGVGKNVIFTGQLPLEDARRCYRAGDAFVFASQSETQGLVIGEAMMNDLPVVALNSPIGEEVYPRTVAVVAEDRAEFVAGVRQVLERRPDAMVLRARQFVEKNFSKHQMTEKQLAVFEAAIAKAPANLAG